MLSRKEMKLPWVYTGENERRICLSISAELPGELKYHLYPSEIVKSDAFVSVKHWFSGHVKSWCNGRNLLGRSPQHLELLTGGTWLGAVLHHGLSGQAQPCRVPGSWGTWEAIVSRNMKFCCGKAWAKRYGWNTCAWSRYWRKDCSVFSQ